jgi:dipeptidyl aminopeptidase/acylaminoacyl peptidase
MRRVAAAAPVVAAALVASTLALPLPFSAFAAANGEAEAPALPDPRWSVDDVIAAEGAEDWTVSRDGRLAAWVKTTMVTEEGEQKPAANLQLCRLDGEAAPGSASEKPCRPLTRGPGERTDPAFSPDAAHIAYRSADPLPDAGGGENGGDDDKPQLWVLPLAGGAPWPLTRFDRPVAVFGWIDSRSLAVLAAESPTAWEREREEAGDSSVVVEDAEREPPVRLFRVGLDGEVERITDNRLWLDGLAVAPDGRRAVVAERESLSFEFDARVPPRLYLVDLATGGRTLLLEGERLLPYAVQWAPDSSGFYFVDRRSNHPLYREATVADLWFYDLAASSPSRLPLDPRGLGGAYAPTPDGVIALEASGVRLTPVRVARTAGGWERRPLAAGHDGQIQGWELAPGGTSLVYKRSTAAMPPQWWTARLEGDAIAAPRELTDLNPSWRAKPTGRVEVVRWAGALGEEVEGLLHYPLDWFEDGAAAPGRTPGRRPLILNIHGGPAGADYDAWDFDWADPVMLWRQRGAFVLQANYHGSSDYGLDWVTSIEKRYYELEVPDLEAGVDFAIAGGLADPERLAAIGWSNGGILTAALITESRRYRAASIGAADVEWISDWANVDFGATFDNYYFGGPPWEIPEVYIEKSPFFDLPEVTTPSIVFTGTEDRAVPPHQSWSIYRVLQQVGKAPVRLVLFPGEPHSLRKPAHQRRKVEEEMAWLERWLWGEEGGGARPGARRPEAVPAGSPLAALLGRAKAARARDAFGVEAGGVLAPETVPFRGLAVGRFEVTRAQWAEFDPAAAPAPGEEELPATGMPFERAREYAAWLAAKTGRPFRLPTAAEAEALAGAAENGGGGGNTLARWTGAAPNPEDGAAIAAALAEAAARLGRAAPLLLPVGSFPGTGDDPLFDLDGNAAEWAAGDDGAGVPAGPSADRADDPRGGESASDPAYVGLRVVADG